MRKMLSLLSLVFLLGGAPPGPRPASNQAAVHPMPPHPGLRERAQREEVQLPTLLSDPALRWEKGIDRPLPHAAPVLGSWKAIALLVQFTDNPSQVGASYFDTLLFGAGAGALPDYYRAVSYGALDIVTVNLPSSVGWVSAPRTYAYYVNGDYGWGPYPQNAQKLAEDAVLAADPVVDFSHYDNDGDGRVDTVFIVHAGQGAEYSGDANDIWSHSWVTVNGPTVDGVTIYNYTTEPEYWQTPGDMTIGVYAHELGHALGVPDLYDYDGSSAGVGDWSLMGYGGWNGPWPGGSSPAFLDAWSRAQLGYLTPVTVTENRLGASIPQAETSQTVYRLWTDGSSGQQYFLIENRQLTGYDAYLPAAGLLIWHVDESRWDNDHECDQLSNWLCGANRFRVALEQADGFWQLEHGSSYGDVGDPYPGSTLNRAFTWTSVPNSSSYTSSANTWVGVANISDSGYTMTADLKVSQPSMHVHAIEGEFAADPYGRTLLRMRVLVRDENQGRLGGVSVGVSIWTPDAGPFGRVRITRANGWAPFSWGSNAPGTWRLCVDEMTKTGYAYDPGDNRKTCQEWYN